MRSSSRLTGQAGGLSMGRSPAMANLPGRVDGERFRRAFTGASYSDPDLAGWWPGDYSGHGAISEDRHDLARRVHDLVRNDGWAASSVTKFIDTVVGSGWIFISQPNARALGITEDQAAELAVEIEDWLDEIADDPDCNFDGERTHPQGLLTALAMRHRITDGEALGRIGWCDRGGPCGTTLTVIDPDRLSNPDGTPDTTLLKSGVALGALQYDPIGYWFRCAHPADSWDGLNVRWEYVPREVQVPGFGTRRQVLHAFEPTRAGERRGFPPLAPVLKKFRMLGNYDVYETQAALINALMAMFITSPYDLEQVEKSLEGELSEYQKLRMEMHSEHPLRMAGAKVNFLAPGETVTLTNPNHPNAVYEPFVRAGLRNIASVAGQTYEQFTGDLSQVNYSSIRAGIIEVVKGFMARSAHFDAMWQKPLNAVLIQEGIERGRIRIPKGAPSFYERKAAYCAGESIGPGQGWVDPLKEAQAVRERLSLRITSRRREAAALGMRLRTLIHENSRDDADMVKGGLDPNVASAERGLPAGDTKTEPKGGGPQVDQKA